MIFAFKNQEYDLENLCEYLNFLNEKNHSWKLEQV